MIKYIIIGILIVVGAIVCAFASDSIPNEEKFLEEIKRNQKSNQKPNPNFVPPPQKRNKGEH